MASIRYTRYSHVVTYGWKDAKEISCMQDVNRSRISVFFDILSCFCKYYVFSNQYKSNRFWEIGKEEKAAKGFDIGAKNKERDKWVDYYFSNWNFLSKYTSFKWQNSPKLANRRMEMYQKHYGFKYPVNIQYGVTIICEHFSIGKITMGQNVLLARDCDIDYTGDLEIGDNVGILEGAKILTHAHDTYHFMNDFELIPFSNRAYKTNLKIGNNVSICARAIILPGVREIGENSIIAAGSVVNRPVPPNVIVEGVPAKVVRKIPVGTIQKTH